MDLHDQLTNFGAARFTGGLNLAANLLGKPGKMEIQGDMVQDMYDDGRLDETYVRATYGDHVQEILGSAGDLIIADTAGYHKGKRVRKGQRLILQMEYAVSRLGASCQYDLLPRTNRPHGLFPHTFDMFGG